MKKIEMFRLLQNECRSELVVMNRKIEDAITELVKDLGGAVEIKDDFVNGISLITEYIDDDNYIQVEQVYINNLGNVMVDRNIDTCNLNELDIDSKMLIFDWLIDQQENPEKYDDEYEDEEMEC